MKMENKTAAVTTATAVKTATNKKKVYNSTYRQIYYYIWQLTK